MKGMKGPPGVKSKMPGMSSGSGPVISGLSKQGGGGVSGLAAGLQAARPVKPGRMASMKKQMFGGGM